MSGPPRARTLCRAWRNTSPGGRASLHMPGIIQQPPDGDRPDPRLPQTWEMSLLRHERLPARATLRDGLGPMWAMFLDGYGELETAGGRQRLSAGDAVLVDSRTARRITAVGELDVAVADL